MLHDVKLRRGPEKAADGGQQTVKSLCVRLRPGTHKTQNAPCLSTEINATPVIENCQFPGTILL